MCVDVKASRRDSCVYGWHALMLPEQLCHIHGRCHTRGLFGKYAGDCDDIKSDKSSSGMHAHDAKLELQTGHDNNFSSSLFCTSRSAFLKSLTALVMPSFSKQSSKKSQLR